jgi:N-acetylneuraminic acid mutarotase
MISALLASCGGGGGRGSGTAPPSGLSYPAPPTLYVGTASAPLSPMVTGTVSSYAVTPSLPAGLALNATSGVISGTPSAVAATASYTFTASNSGGSTTAMVSITVASGTASKPAITTQPAAATVPVYRSATFTVAATGNGTLSYQWYFVAGSTDPGPPITTPIAGATSATVTLPSVQAVNAGLYTCIVTDSFHGSTATTSSQPAMLTVLSQRGAAALSGESAVLPATAGHVVSTPAQAGVTYEWTITNGTLSAGQGTNQVTYTSGSLGHTRLTLTILTSTGAALAAKSVAVVAAVPVASVFAQASVLPGSTGILASAPSFAGQTYAWMLTGAGAAVTGGQTAAVLTYSVGTSPGTYQLGLGLTDLVGNHGSGNETVSIVSNTFVADPRDPGPRSLHTATLLNDGRVLIAGGDAGIPDFGNPGNADTPVAGTQSVILATAELFDPATLTFASVGSMATARFEHTATLLNDGRVLIVGGGNASAPALASTEIYDPAARTWTAGPSLATARALHTATLLADGRVLVAGGVNTFGVINTAEVYDPVANAWSAAGTMLAAHVLHSAVLLPNGRVLVAGGRSSSAELYDPSTNTWTATTPVPGSGGPLVVLLSGQVFESADGLLYDPSTATWTNGLAPVPLSPLVRAGTNVVLLPDGRVFQSGQFFGSAGGSGIYDPISQTWSGSPGPDPADNSYSSATVLADGRVLTLGGLAASSSGLAVAQDYVSSGFASLTDPVAATVTVVPPAAHQGGLAASALLTSGRVLFSGGFVAREPFAIDVTNASDLYDPTTNAWTSAAAMITARGGHTETALADGSALAAGGYNGAGAVFAAAERYEAQTNTWIAAGAMANPRYQHTAALLASGLVLVAGGSNALIGSCSCTTFLAAAELYNPSTNIWTSTGALATARYGHTATVLPNGKVLVTGGFGGATNTLQNTGAALQSAEIYDPGTGLWSSAAPMNVARYNQTATLLGSGLVLVTGGTSASTPTATAEIYDPAGNTWTAVGSLATARTSHAAVLLASGHVLVVGGYNTSASAVYGVASAEIYDPVAQTFSSAGAMITLRQGFTLNALSTGRVMLVGGTTLLAGTPEFYR